MIMSAKNQTQPSTVTDLIDLHDMDIDPTLAQTSSNDYRFNIEPTPAEAAERSKRLRTTPSDLQGANTNYARFLVIKSLDDSRHLNKLSPFARAAAVNGYIGKPKNLRPLRSGDLLLEVFTEKQAQQALNMKLFIDIPISVTADM